MISVPVVDLSASDGDASEVVRNACEDVGFFYVKNHGIPEKLISQHFLASRNFFDLPTEAKTSVKVNQYQNGWMAMNDETLDPKRQKVADTKESFSSGREIPLDSEELKKPMHGPNNWPSEEMAPGFKQTMSDYLAACWECTKRIVHLIALSLDLPPTFLDEHFQQPILMLRPMHYAAQVSAPEEGVYAAGQHTDYGVVTILATDEVPGLQIWLEEHWVDVLPREGHLIVNLGDMLHRWTNGKFKSALHRVVTFTGEERYSTPFFVAPNWNAKVVALPTCVSDDNPAKWPPTTCGQHLQARYAATYGTYASGLEKHQGSLEGAPNGSA